MGVAGGGRISWMTERIAGVHLFREKPVYPLAGEERPAYVGCVEPNRL